MKRIESSSNPILKTVRRLAHPRRREPRVLLEGEKLVRTAVESGHEIETLLVAASLDRERWQRLVTGDTEVVQVSDAAFRAETTLVSPEGILAIAKRPRPPRDTLQPEGIVVVSAGIQDPGNLGAVARVSEAAGARALAVLPGSADPFGPKALRGSMGSLLRLPMLELADVSELVEAGFRLAALVSRGGVDFRDADYRTPLAVLLGRESTGLSESALAAATLRLTIPMAGGVESLNVATAAALVLYEAARRKS